MANEFPDAVEKLREIFYGKLAEVDAEVRHVTDPQRLEEAIVVVPVARAFAEAELAAADDERSLGIHGRNLVPPLHKQLGKRLRKASSEN